MQICDKTLFFDDEALQGTSQYTILYKTQNISQKD